MTIKIIHKSTKGAEKKVGDLMQAGYSVLHMTYFLGRVFVILSLPDNPVVVEKSVKLIRKHKDRAEAAIQIYLDEGFNINYITTNGFYVLACLQLTINRQPVIESVTDEEGGGDVTTKTLMIRLGGIRFGDLQGTVQIDAPEGISITRVYDWRDTSVVAGITGHEGLTGTTHVTVSLITAGGIYSERFTFDIIVIEKP